ncbi:unnamed protein product, partial [Trichogramma brassicae]
LAGPWSAGRASARLGASLHRQSAARRGEIDTGGVHGEAIRHKCAPYERWAVSRGATTNPTIAAAAKTRAREYSPHARRPRGRRGHESALTGGLPAPLIPSINMWPAPDELTRGAPADSAAAANDILPSIELTPPETRRRDSESRGNAFSRSPKRSDSEMSDGAPTVVQVPPSQPSMTDNFTARAHPRNPHAVPEPSRSVLAINMRLDQELVHRTSSNASRRSSHSSRQNSGKSESDASRTPSSSKKRASDRRQRDPTPHDGASPAVKASRSETQVPKEQRHAGGDARRDVDTTPKRTGNKKNSRKE